MEHEAQFFRQLDQETLAESASAATTPAGSRVASPAGPAALPGPCTAPQPTQLDVAAVVTQHLGHTPCSEEIRRHYPHVQARPLGAAASCCMHARILRILCCLGHHPALPMCANQPL